MKTTLRAAIGQKVERTTRKGLLILSNGQVVRPVKILQPKNGKCAKIIELYKKGKTRAAIVKRGFNPTTVSCQIWRYNNGLSK